MSFTIEPVGSIQFVDKNGNTIEFPPERLVEKGEHKIISSPQFKDDGEVRVADFVVNVPEGEVKVEVTYTLGVDGAEIDSVDIRNMPDELELQNGPYFKIVNQEE